MKRSVLLFFGMLFSVMLFSQPVKKDKAVFKIYKEGFFEKFILSGIQEFEDRDSLPPQKRSFKIDMSGMDILVSKDQFQSQWHNTPVSQGNTGSCWCFSGTSFLETEIFRLNGQKVKLSEMYTVYWEYVEKARRYVRERGNSLFDQGSECNAVVRQWKTYGIVPLSEYTGLLPGQVYHNHEKMVGEMTEYLKSVKASNAWNEALVISTIKSILNHYMGEPPATFTVSGKEYTPQRYLKDFLKINLDDYVDVMSLMEKPYGQKAEYEVPDNWWHCNTYYNVPLDVFMDIIKKSISKGYTMGIGGDVSEAGFDARDHQTAIVPSFDIPSAYIDENARQMRFLNGSTTDDHGMHIVGYLEKNGSTWYLLKDSGAGSKTGGPAVNKNYGYYFFHEDYFKLKMMNIIVHKDMVQPNLK